MAARKPRENTNPERDEYESLPDRAEDLLRRSTTRKSVMLPGQKPPPESLALPSEEEAKNQFNRAGALQPPYDPGQLLVLYEHAGALRPNVEGYATNIEAFGYRLEPAIKLEASTASKEIGDAIYLERLSRDYDGGIPPAVTYPTEEEIANKKREWETVMRIEFARATRFFDHCCAESSLVELRMQTRTDMEITGNGFWECLRDVGGRLSQFVYLPSESVRLMPFEPTDTVTYQVRELIAPGAHEKVQRRRRFRRYIQVVMGRAVYFKELGDPRTVSAESGKAFASVADLKSAEGAEATPATEVLHFRVFSARSGYGIPRWIASLLSVLGSRASEEVNYLYFDNKSIPPMAVTVSNGKLSASSHQKLETFIRDKIKGRENFHKILILEAESGGGGSATSPQDSGRTVIKFEPLTQAQQQDALFQNYDERNIDKLGMAFRMPRLLRGDVRDFNKATADAALEFTEQQVFQPERERFDSMVNRRVMPDLGFRFWAFASNSASSQDPDKLVDRVLKLSTAGTITPSEGRTIVGPSLGMELKPIDEDWVDRPLSLTLAGYSGPMAFPAPTTLEGESDGAPPPPALVNASVSQETRSLAAVAANLKSLVSRMREVANKEHATVDRAERAKALEVERIVIKQEEMDRLLSDEPALTGT